MSILVYVFNSCMFCQGTAEKQYFYTEQSPFKKKSLHCFIQSYDKKHRWSSLCTIIRLLLSSNMLKQYSAACTRFMYKMEFKYAYACSGRGSYISSIKSKPKLFSNKKQKLLTY